jgi:hypothetical protein
LAALVILPAFNFHLTLLLVSTALNFKIGMKLLGHFKKVKNVLRPEKFNAQDFVAKSLKIFNLRDKIVS